MRFPFLALPQELQLKVLESLDKSSLAGVCLVSKSLSVTAVRMLWRDIDFEKKLEKFDDYYDVRAHFLIVCDWLMKNKFNRWQELATNVRSLRMGSIKGAEVSGFIYHGGGGKHNALREVEAFIRPKAGVTRSVYEIFAAFHNLELLSFVIQKYEVVPWARDEGLARRIRIPKLRRLQIESHVSIKMLQALMSWSENISDLSCCAAMRLFSRQEEPMQLPDPQYFFSSVEHQLSTIRNLHLSKIRVFNEDYDRENDYATLKLWAIILPYLAMTLMNLILEDHGVPIKALDNNNSEYSDTKQGNLAWDRGTTPTRERFQEILHPVFTERSWPNLQGLKTFGLSPYNSEENCADPFAQLRPRVHVEHQRGLFKWCGV